MIRLPKVHGGQALKHRMMLKLAPIVMGADAPDVLRILFYRHALFGKPMGALHQRVLRGPSDWSVGERELFAAYVSMKNACRFCKDIHAAIAGRAMPRNVVDAALAGDIGELSAKAQAFLAFLDKLTVSPEAMTLADLSPLRAVQISDAAILDGTYVCMIFSTMNRVVDALGCEDMTPRQLDKVSAMLIKAYPG